MTTNTATTNTATIATGEAVTNAADARRVLAILAEPHRRSFDATPDDGVPWEWDTLLRQWVDNEWTRAESYHEGEMGDAAIAHLEGDIEQMRPDVEPIPVTYAHGDNVRSFVWWSRFTRDRWVSFTFSGDRCLMKWDSGTGRPSSFIGEVMDAIGVIG